MPVLKHAKKKLRQDKKRTVRNAKVKQLYKDSLKKARTQPTVEAIRHAVSAIDKATKKHLIHKNKAARLKSSLAKLATKKTLKKEVEKPAVKKAPLKPKTAKVAKKPSPPSVN